MARRTIPRPGRTSSRKGHIQKLSAKKQSAQHPITDLQQSAGNQAVQRLLRSPYIQEKLQVSSSGDQLEREADHKAEAVMRSPSPEQDREKTVGSIGEKMREEPIQAKAQAGGGEVGSSKVESQIGNMRGTGAQLPIGVRSDFESRLGQDFSGVRVHKDSQAAESAAAINAKAYTTGKDIVFGAGSYAPETAEGQKLLAHELMHVVQQESAGMRVQRYEAGEHAKMGETQTELKALFVPLTYEVVKGDSLTSIAKKFKLKPDEIKTANKDKIKSWTASDGSGKTVEGFNTGEKISIPQKLSDFAKAATKDPSAKLTVNGVVMDYGVGIAMGDLYETPEKMAKASKKEIEALAALIEQERTTGVLVPIEKWQKATGGRFLDLAEQNVAHFAPQRADLASTSAAGKASPNHKSEWEKHHLAALKASKSGNKEKAMMINAFGDHFLTDAFAAGHLINKTDVMELFKSQLKLEAGTEDFDAPSTAFFDAVATDAFTGAVQTEFSKYETFEPIAGFHPDIDRPGRFSTLLQRIHREKPDLVANAIAKGVHDKLNTLPGGLPVENDRGDPPWKLSGDNTLNDETRKVARKAVAQSQFNIIAAYKAAGPLDTAALFKQVWDYTPKPSAAGIKVVAENVTKGTDINNADLRKGVVTLIKDNHLEIINKLVKLKRLRKA